MTPRRLRKGKLASKPAPRLESPSQEKLTYALGVAIAKTFKRQGVTLDGEPPCRGIDDSRESSCSRLESGGRDKTDV